MPYFIIIFHLYHDYFNQQKISAQLCVEISNNH